MNVPGFALPGLDDSAADIARIFRDAADHGARPAISPHAPFLRTMLGASDTVRRSASEVDATAASDDHTVIGDRALALTTQRPSLKTEYHPYRRVDRRATGSHEEHELIDRVLEPEVKEWSAPVQALNGIAHQIEAHERPAFLSLSPAQVRSLSETFDRLAGTDAQAVAIGASASLFAHLHETQIAALCDAARNLPTGLARGQAYMGLGRGAARLTPRQLEDMRIDVGLLGDEQARSYGLAGLNAGLESYAEHERPEIVAATFALTDERCKSRALGALGLSFAAIPESITPAIERIEALADGASRGVAIQGAMRGAHAMSAAQQERLYEAGRAMTRSAEGRGRALGGVLAQHDDLHDRLARETQEEILNESSDVALSYLLDAAGSGLGRLPRADRDALWQKVTASGDSAARMRGVAAFASAGPALDATEVDRVFATLNRTTDEGQHAEVLAGLAAGCSAWVHVPNRLTTVLRSASRLRSDHDRARVYGRLARHAVYLDATANQAVVDGIAALRSPLACGRALMWMNASEPRTRRSSEIAATIQAAQKQLVAVRDARLPVVRERAIEHFYQKAEQQLAIERLDGERELVRVLKEAGYADESVAREVARRHELGTLQDRQLIEAPVRRQNEQIALDRHRSITERVLGTHTELMAEGFEALVIAQGRDALGLHAAIHEARTATQHRIVNEASRTNQVVAAAIGDSARQCVEAQAILANRLAQHTDDAMQLVAAQQNERLNMISTQTANLRRDMYHVGGLIGAELIGRDEAQRRAIAGLASAPAPRADRSGGETSERDRVRTEHYRWRTAQSQLMVGTQIGAFVAQGAAVAGSVIGGVASTVASNAQSIASSIGCSIM